MKRTGVFLTLLLAGVCLFGFAAKDGVGFQRDLNVRFGMCLEDELPWSVVDAVLHKVEEVTHYTYPELVEWYSDALVTVEEIGGGSYRVVITEGGEGAVVIIDNL
jgi:hypothetical protein